jgi:hypothetical protein
MPKNNAKKVIDKSQISQPTQFTHLQHIGALDNEEIQVNLCNEDESTRLMREILVTLNMSNMPINKKTRAVVTNFIKDHGGIDQFKEDLKNHKPPPPPQISVTQQSYQPVSHPQPTRETGRPPSLPQPTRRPPPPPPSGSKSNREVHAYIF